MQPDPAYTIVFGEVAPITSADFAAMRDAVHNIVESFGPDFPV